MEENIEEVSTVGENSAVLENTVETKKKVPVLTICLFIVCLVLACLLIYTSVSNKPRTTFKLEEVYESYFTGKEGSVTLPENYMVCKNGQLLYNDNGLVDVRGALIGADMTSDEFDEMVDSYKESYELSEITDKEYRGYSFVYESDSGNNYVYVLYKDDVFVQLITLQESTAQSILNSIKF